MTEAIRIIGLRPYYNQQKKSLDVKEKKFPVSAKSTASLFANVDKILGSIPKEEHWNLFWTAGYCKEGSRNIEKMDALCFDIDDIEEGKDEKYIDAICRALNVDADKCPITFTGNGIQIVISLKEPLLGADIDKYKAKYNAHCKKIDKELANRALQGHADNSVFSAARILRLPNTKNIKPMKYAVDELTKMYCTEVPEVKVKQARLYQSKLNGTGFSFMEDIELQFEEATPKPKETPTCTPVYPSVDKQTVISECDFIKWSFANPEKVTEPLWYASLGITSFFGDNNEFSHKLSEKYKGYSYEETEAKAKQANEATTGPRTCQSIKDVWDGCDKCKHAGKITTPIQLKAPDFIGTEASGFTTLSNKGKVTYQYLDLMNFLQRETPHITDAETKQVYIYKNGYWQWWPDLAIKAYAQEKFFPRPQEAHALEFLNTIKRSNVKGQEFREALHQDYLNMHSGILHLPTRTLQPHSPNFFFKYKLPYDYDANSICPTWDRMMDNIMLGRKHLISIIEEFMGYSIKAGRYDIQKILVFSGEGNNGKSTVCSAIQNLIGHQNYSAVSISEMGSNRFLAIKLKDKFINFSEEEPVSCFKSTGYIKKLVGNTPISAEEKNMVGFTFTNRAKIIMSYNEVPHLPDTTLGMKRRLLIIPFDLNISEKPEACIPNIDKKLYDERPGILNRAIEGLDRLSKRGDFPPLDESLRVIEEMERDSDAVKEWMDKFVVVTSNEKDRITTKEAYDKFRKDMYHESQKEGVVMPRTFTKRITKMLTRKYKHKCGYKRMRIGNQLEWCFYGVSVDCDAEKVGVKDEF